MVPLLLSLLLLPAGSGSLSGSFQNDPKQKELRDKFAEAVHLGDQAQMDKLIRRYSTVAPATFISQADLRVLDPSKDLDLWVDSFIEAWNRAKHSEFARNYDRYLQRLDPERREAREKLTTEKTPELIQLQTDAIGSGKAEDWRLVQTYASDFLQAIQGTGDLYFISFACHVLGNAWNTAVTDAGDDRKALEYYEKFMQARTRLDLVHDAEFAEVKKLARGARARLGIPDPESGKVEKPEYPAEMIQPVDGAEWKVVKLKPGAETRVGKIVHPSDLADAFPPTWKLGGVGKRGESNVLAGLDPEVTIKRIDLQHFVLDCGGETTKEFKITTKPQVILYKRKHADGKVDQHALMLAVGTEQDPFQGAEVNLAPTDNFVTIMWRSAATRSSKTPFGTLTLFDLNCDGHFGYDENPPAGIVGIWKNAEEKWLRTPRFDAVLLGKGKHSFPFSHWIPGPKDQWYELVVEDKATGETARLIPVAPHLGTLEVQVKGVKILKPVSLVFQSQTKPTKGLVIDVAFNRKLALPVPIGEYVFVQGILRGPKTQEAIILPGDVPIKVQVEEGKTETLVLGAPFHLDARTEIKDGTLTVDGKTLHVLGSKGEFYTHLVGAPLSGTELLVKGGKTKKMRASTADEIAKDWYSAYYPQNVEVKVPPGGKTIFRLFLKKHPWFGKLESE